MNNMQTQGHIKALGSAYLDILQPPDKPVQIEFCQGKKGLEDDYRHIKHNPEKKASFDQGIFTMLLFYQRIQTEDPERNQGY